MEPNFKDSLKTLFGKVSCIGALDGGGVTRLGYSDEEDEMHRIFRETAESMGLYVWEDRAGTSFASNMPEGTCAVSYTHLDARHGSFPRKRYETDQSGRRPAWYSRGYT